MTRRTYTLLGLIPLALFIALATMLVLRLENPRMAGSVDSPLIGRPLPAIGAAVKGPAIVNMFASWCAPCALEHPLLMQAKKDGTHIIGIAYKDSPEKIAEFLQRMGNPYDLVIMDPNGTIGLDLGITGVPESFAVDKLGLVRNRMQGPFTDQQTLMDFLK